MPPPDKNRYKRTLELPAAGSTPAAPSSGAAAAAPEKTELNLDDPVLVATAGVVELTNGAAVVGVVFISVAKKVQTEKSDCSRS
jgi:hypothetical protein